MSTKLPLMHIRRRRRQPTKATPYSWLDVHETGYKSKPVVNPQKLAVHPRARSRDNFERWHGWFDAAIYQIHDDQGMGNRLGGRRNTTPDTDRTT